MSTFVLIPGAGGDAAYWHRLVPELERRGHRAVPVDIREDDPSLGLADWAALVDEAIPVDADDVVLVAQSLGGFTAPMVRRPVSLIVLLNAMIPRPGEPAGDWWENTGSEPARVAAEEAAGRDPAFDLERHFFHDLPADVKAVVLAGEQRGPSERAFADPCTFERWPDVPIKVLVGRDDRFFPADFQRRVARDRLGIDTDEIAGGHLVALSNPTGLADALVNYVDAAPIVA
jgi:pimeloyl-ACP methyl ester carboxylesterase